LSEIGKADRILYLHDSTQQFDKADEALLQKLGETGVGITIVHNKMDQMPRFDLDHRRESMRTGAGVEHIGLSAKTGQGMLLLRQHLKECVGYHAASEGQFMARRRHVEALQRALQHVQTGQLHLSQSRAGELLAEELRLAQNTLAEITGAFTSEDLLTKIFASFCIGK
jgi:tRNA modification GTPase